MCPAGTLRETMLAVNAPQAHRNAAQRHCNVCAADTATQPKAVSPASARAGACVLAKAMGNITERTKKTSQLFSPAIVSQH